MKKKIIKCKLLFIIIVCLSCFLHWNTKSVQADDKDRNYKLLVINSYHNGHKWEGNILEGVNQSVSLLDNYNIYTQVEYLDFRYNYDEKYIEQFISMLESKYPKGSIDGIYTIDNEAFLNIKEKILDKESQFYQVPLLFSGVNGEIILTEEEEKYITGIYERDDTVQLLNLISDMNNDLKRINVIVENSGYGESIKEEINQQLNEHWKDKFEVNYISGNYIEDIEAQLEKAIFDEQGAVIIGGEFQYKANGVYLEPKETIDIVKKYTTNPIYSNDHTYIDAGILGGCIDIGEEHGQNIINMFTEILGGRSISDINAQLEPTASKFINYRQIYEFNINPKDIPIYSVIRDKKFYEMLIPKNVQYAIFVGVAIIIIIVISLILKAAKEKKKRIKQEEVDKLRNDYIINISHELRTPLNVIINTVKMLELKIKCKDIDLEYLSMRLNNIEKNSFRLLNLVNNFVDTTKLELGFLKLNLTDENIIRICEELCESVRDYCLRKDISLIFNSKEDILVMAIDKEKIERVILNLLSNAIKFTENGGEIQVIIEKNNDNISISIKDTGIGIAKELQKNIFTKFYQVDDILTRSNEGSGMGLFISKDIIKLHKGNISVISNVGIGSIFTITMPITICNNSSEKNCIIDSGNDVKLLMSDID